jgi:hypothetical protein
MKEDVHRLQKGVDDGNFEYKCEGKVGEEFNMVGNYMEQRRRLRKEEIWHQLFEIWTWKRWERVMDSEEDDPGYA